MLDKRVWIRVWHKYPIIAVQSPSFQDKLALSTIAEEVGPPLWRLLNRDCAQCIDQISIAPDIFMIPFNTYEAITGGKDIYIPHIADNKINQNEYFESSIASGKTVFTSLPIRDIEPQIAREIVVISPMAGSIGSDSTNRQLRISIFEALSGLRLPYGSDQYKEALSELDHGCFSKIEHDCPLVEFSTFTYKVASTFRPESTSFDSALSQLCALYEKQAKDDLGR